MIAQLISKIRGAGLSASTATDVYSSLNYGNMIIETLY